MAFYFNNNNFIVVWKLQNACATQVAERVISDGQKKSNTSEKGKKDKLSRVYLS